MLDPDDLTIVPEMAKESFIPQEFFDATAYAQKWERWEAKSLRELNTVVQAFREEMKAQNPGLNGAFLELLKTKIIDAAQLALHYVESFDRVCHKIHHCLAPNGLFLFSVEHPIFTTLPAQDWY